VPALMRGENRAPPLVSRRILQCSDLEHEGETLEKRKGYGKEKKKEMPLIRTKKPCSRHSPDYARG